MDRQPIIDHIPSLRRYARALTGDAWAADDLVQDTLERGCTKWRLWLAGTDLRAWLFTLMHNLYVDGLRRAARPALAAAHLDIEEVAPELPRDGDGIEQALDLQRCLLRLPAEQREVLLLVTLEDLSYAEVARITGVPVGTVMSRLSRARTRLRTLMDATPVRSPGPAAPGEDSPALRRLK